uniref:RNase H type-1 domain-containing protein n=1 Tax=Brassica oleracea var. oleracea TaxID=109376 RepID=A0A0D3C3R7_BRAOL
MGWVMKTEEGAILCRGSSNRSHVCSALMAEALTMRDTLKRAKELNLQSLQIFSDCQVLISALCKGRDVNEIAENSQADSLARSSLGRLDVVD